MTNSNNGRALYRSLFPELMRALLEISVPPLRLDADPDAAGDLSRFAAVYAWPDRRVEVTATETSLLIRSDDGESEALPLDDPTFIVDPLDPDNPSVTFGAFDPAGRPRVLYEMLWGLPRLDN
jgi:hypothetical protein